MNRVKKVKEVLVVVLLILPLIVMAACKGNSEEASKKESDEQKLILEGDSVKSEEAATMVRDGICVYVVGEVAVPGVYMLAEDARVYDAVEAAGGFTDNAAKEYINLAGKVSDGEKIIVYSTEQVSSGDIINEESSLVNINTANVDKLMTLPGIGESRANDIIKYREKNGRFETIEDIMKVSGIKQAAFSKIEDLITVN